MFCVRLNVVIIFCSFDGWWFSWGCNYRTEGDNFWWLFDSENVMVECCVDGGSAEVQIN